jgi:3-phosphoinositide dependent protein kinase-1
MAVGEEMEKEFESKLRLQQQQQLAKKQEAMQRANSIAFRAPQEQFTIDNFELGKMYGTGSYSKVLFFSTFDSPLYALIYLGNQRQ